MIGIQVLNKILETKNPSMMNKHALSPEHFPGYENEFKFISEHYKQYGKVPDTITFLNKFSEFPIIEVNEPDEFLLDTLFEEILYYRSVGVVQKVADLLKSNSNEAVEYLQSELPNLKIESLKSGVDIISEARERFDVYKEKVEGDTPWYITTGFPELDSIIHGWAKGEELVVLFARTGQGKSWVLTKTLAHAWEIGLRVGYISPEMSPVKIGYRVDTLLRNFSNSDLIYGKEVPDYEKYIEDLKKHKNPFIVATPLDFQKKVTISKLKNFCIENKLDVLGIDGITYLTDERFKKGDNKTITLTNISEDLSSLSLELGIPVIIVVQSNRSGIKEESDGTPDLESIRDSDGIAYNATKVIALRQTGAGLEFGIKKHRDGMSGGKLTYFWNIDHGKFEYIPATDDSVVSEIREQKSAKIKESFHDAADVF